MPRPRYSATKRARETNKQQERARKLARKHGRAAQRTRPEGVGKSSAPEAPGHSSAEQPSDGAATGTSGATGLGLGPEASSGNS